MNRVFVVLVLAVFIWSCDSGSSRDKGDGSSQRAAARTEARTTNASATQTASATQPQHERLYGTWVANDVDTKLGDVKVQVTFKEQGPVKILAWSDLPLVGQVRDKQAPYEVHGNTISSDALRGGTSVKYHFDGDDLIIQYNDGKTVRFNRKS
jgi:hypothetical protein